MAIKMVIVMAVNFLFCQMHLVLVRIIGLCSICVRKRDEMATNDHCCSLFVQFDIHH